jgi:hypothetical protein
VGLGSDLSAWTFGSCAAGRDRLSRVPGGPAALAYSSDEETLKTQATVLIGKTAWCVLVHWKTRAGSLAFPRALRPPLRGYRAPNAGDVPRAQAHQFIVLGACRTIDAFAAVVFVLLNPAPDGLGGRGELLIQSLRCSSTSN